MKYEICYMCQGSTNEPKYVFFRGWNKELRHSVRIPLCSRCRGVWKIDVKVIFVSVGKMTQVEAYKYMQTMMESRKEIPRRIKPWV